MKVSKVSIIFDYFWFEFASETVLILNLGVFDAEFYSLSNDIIFRGNHPAENVAAKIGINGELSESFIIETDVIEGELLSSMAYLIALSD